jgi:hypothetical protein
MALAMGEAQYRFLPSQATKQHTQGMRRGEYRVLERQAPAAPVRPSSGRHDISVHCCMIKQRVILHQKRLQASLAPAI